MKLKKPAEGTKGSAAKHAKPMEIWDLKHDVCRGKGTISVPNPASPGFHLAEICSCRFYTEGTIGRAFHILRNKSQDAEAMKIYAEAPRVQVSHAA
jgi:hypothetical protein